MNTNTRIDVEIPTITGKTTLYGTVVGVGGVDPPRSRIRLLSGNILSCNITRRGQLQIARQLGQRLYTDVGVYGTARWDIRDMSIDYFLIEKLTDYSKKPIDEALESLYLVAGKALEDIQDIDQFVAEIRGYDEEEF